MKDEKLHDKSVEPESVQGRSVQGRSVAGKKKPYHPPVIQVYGTVQVLTQATGSGAADGGTRKNSDINAKENIVRIGTHPLGFGLYLFDYKASFVAYAPGRHFGVMAQEVEAIVPSAVSTGTHGYKQVDYAVLGVHPVMH